MKTSSKVILISIFLVAIGISYYSLYQYNYHEAKETLSLVMPDYMLAYAELTTGDIARFTPEQEYTFALIKNNVLVAKSNNTSNLSNEDIAIKVMDEFIRGGYTYCNDVSLLSDGGLFCNDVDQNHSKQDRFFEQKYNEIMAANPNNPLTGLGKFFGLNMLAYAQPNELNITQLWVDTGLIHPLIYDNLTGAIITPEFWPPAVIYQSDDMIVIHNSLVEGGTQPGNEFWHAVDIVRKQGYEISEVTSTTTVIGTGFSVILIKK